MHRAVLRLSCLALACELGSAFLAPCKLGRFEPLVIDIPGNMDTGSDEIKKLVNQARAAERTRARVCRAGRVSARGCARARTRVSLIAVCVACRVSGVGVGIAVRRVSARGCARAGAYECRPSLALPSSWSSSCLFFTRVVCLRVRWGVVRACGAAASQEFERDRFTRENEARTQQMRSRSR